MRIVFAALSSALLLGISAVSCGSEDSGGGGKAGADAGDASHTGGSGGSKGGSGGTGGTALGGGSGGIAGIAIGGNAGVAGSPQNDASYSADCTGLCQKSLAAGCPNDDPIHCVQDCERGEQKLAQCKTEIKSYFACASTPQGQFSCTPSGNAKLYGCEAEALPGGICAACIATESDDFCDICLKQTCCAEQIAVLNTSDYLPFSGCASICQTQGCLDTCKAQFPIAGAALDVLVACGKSKCPGSCGTGAEADAGTTSDMVTNYCNALVATGCSGSSDSVNCQNQNKTAGQTLDSYGCGLPLYLALGCTVNNPISCDADGGLVTDPSCTLGDCVQTGATCDSFLSLNGSCGSGCDDWFGSCAPSEAGAGVSCSCGLGSKKGTSFDLASNCSELSTYTTIRTNCK